MSTATEIVVRDRTRVFTTVAKSDKDVDDCIKKFPCDKDVKYFLCTDRKRMRVIGLDTECTLVQHSDGQTRSELAILQLCDGRHCLILQLGYFDGFPRSVFNFLRLPQYTFVGVEIKDSLAKLEQQYGLSCKNSVDLWTLVGKAVGRCICSACGILGPVAHLCLHDFDESTSVVFDDWGGAHLSKDQVRHATSNVYAYHKMGVRLSSV